MGTRFTRFWDVVVDRLRRDNTFRPPRFVLELPRSFLRRCLDLEEEEDFLLFRFICYSYLPRILEFHWYDCN